LFKLYIPPKRSL